MLLGTMLGDGYIAKSGYFQVNHSPKQAEYLWTKYTVLREFVVGSPSISPKNKLGYASVKFFTVLGPAFRSLHSLFYPTGKKVVTQEWLDRIDRAGFLPSIAWWIADDGSKQAHGRSPNVMVSTHGFSTPEVELLVSWMTGHGYPCQVYFQYRSPKKPMILFLADASRKLMVDLVPHTPPCMRYKLNIEPDPEKVEKRRLYRNTYQQANKEKMRAYALKSYYKKKAAGSPPTPSS